MFVEKLLYFLLTVIVAFPGFSTLPDEPEGGEISLQINNLNMFFY